MGSRGDVRGYVRGAEVADHIVSRGLYEICNVILGIVDTNNSMYFDSLVDGESMLAPALRLGRLSP